MTGGTGGIGYEVARALALANARVLLLARKIDNGHDAVTQIKESFASESGGAARGEADVEFVECDLGSLQKVREVGEMLREREERLDLVRAIVKLYNVSSMLWKFVAFEFCATNPLHALGVWHFAPVAPQRPLHLAFFFSFSLQKPKL